MLKILVSQNARQLIQSQKFTFEFINVFSDGIVFFVYQSEHEFLVLFSKFVTKVHHHKLHETLVNAQIHQHLFRFQVLRKTAISRGHESFLSHEKLHKSSQNLPQIIDNSVVQFQILEKLFGNLAECIFTIFGYCHFLEEYYYKK